MTPSKPESSALAGPSSERALEHLIANYAELVDSGRFAELGALLADASFSGRGAPVTGRDNIQKMFEAMLIVYEDGTPRTKHVTTTLVVEIEEQSGTAQARAYFTVLQSLPDLLLQPVAAGR